MALDPNLKNLSTQAEIAGREIRLSRAQSLPKFDIGYRRNGGSDETLNGFVVGLSIPLFENKNTVRKAKAQFEYSNAVIEDNTRNLKSNLQQLYEQATALQTSCKEYSEILTEQHSVELLNKALMAGQISMIDYFVELTTFYDSRQNYLNVEKEYYNTLAQLYRYKL
jgi:outer membrane protein TolC|nr:TolC family protein [Odoribacter sp. OF09-27XD]